MIKALLEVLAILLRAIERKQAKEEQQDAQAEADRVSTNPTEWFNDHFRVRTESIKTDASKASHDNSHTS
ncbi:hypothetical protein HOR53_gp53 [Pectobacterium phage PP99]|uniref:Uncharacterized protein n=1 Tax=Pectobacterium phage PP99 TaxID=1932883 RepID=A0A1P8L661_9CAUD|nr:hypothetical protein HOR53_gp53 [Pectobacterium phage PP99]APW79743.1 hypothetical protein PP99_53 [Pectobacterium phage PP99]